MRNTGRIATQLGVIVVVLLLACLLAAHADTWTFVLAFIVAIVAFVLLVRAQSRPGRGRLALSLVACGIVLASGTSLVKLGWLEVVGRTSPATVSASDTYCTSHRVCDRQEEYTLRLPDGSTVDGKLRDLEPGTYQVGDRLTVRYDPTGIVREPVIAGPTSGLALAIVLGLDGTGVLVGLALLVGLLLTAGRPPRTARGASPWQPAAPAPGR